MTRMLSVTARSPGNSAFPQGQHFLIHGREMLVGDLPGSPLYGSDGNTAEERWPPD